MGSICNRGPVVINRKPSQVTEYSKNFDIRTKYEFVSILGSGSFGKVRLYRDRQSRGKKYAIKTLVKEGVTRNIFNCLISEVNILRGLDHPNIVKYYETFEDEYYVHIVMEYLQGDDLYKILAQQDKELEERNICDISKQLLKALSFIHKKNIVHRDIKPENILFSKKDDYSTLKLIDFGLATSENRKKDKSAVGSPYYMAPEIIQGKYSTKTDMWSLGVILHLMLTGSFPFKGDKDGGEKDIFYHIVNSPFDSKKIDEAPFSDESKDLVKKLLVKNEDKRLSAEEALCHPWMTKFIRGNRKSTLINKDTLDTIKVFTTKSTLQKEILFFIAKITNESEITRLREMFNQLDTSNSGTLTITEIRKAFLKLGHQLNEEEMTHLWKGLDFHQDGKINYTEFLAATLNSLNFSKEEEIWSAFKYFEEAESGKEGVISVESLLKAIRSFNITVNEEDIRKGFDELENKGKVLDFDVFKELVTNKNQGN